MSLKQAKEWIWWAIPWMGYSSRGLGKGRKRRRSGRKPKSLSGDQRKKSDRNVFRPLSRRRDNDFTSPATRFALLIALLKVQEPSGFEGTFTTGLG